MGRLGLCQERAFNQQLEEEQHRKKGWSASACKVSKMNVFLLGVSMRIDMEPEEGG